MKTVGIFIAVLALSVSGFLAQAEGDEHREVLVNQVREQVEKGMRDWLEKRLREKHREPKRPKLLGKTVKLLFQISPKEKESQPLSIVCATRGYSIETHMKKKKEGFHFEISGQLALVDEKDKILLTYKMSLHFEGHEGAGFVNASGSAVLKYGKPKMIAQLGDMSLIVVVTPEN